MAGKEGVGTVNKLHQSLYLQRPMLDICRNSEVIIPVLRLTNDESGQMVDMENGERLEEPCRSRASGLSKKFPQRRSQIERGLGLCNWEKLGLHRSQDIKIILICGEVY